MEGEIWFQSDEELGFIIGNYYLKPNEKRK